jgi:hypothetical protein
MQRGRWRKCAPSQNQDVGLKDIEDLGWRTLIAGVE